MDFVTVSPYKLVLARSAQEIGELQAYIQEAYSKAFNATIPHFLPMLAGLYRADGVLVGACGMNLASDGRLYLENYLDQPIEQAVAKKLAIAVPARQKIIEIGNFASSEPGNARLMFAALCKLLCDNQLDFVVFTGTAKLRRSFERLSLNPVELALADAKMVGSDADAWGEYYSNQPKVMVGDINAGKAVLEQNSILLNLLAAEMPRFDKVFFHERYAR
ncbi:MAG: thermostable hemolysin [Vibrionaceae bacterium]